jgi:protein-S-isoprenylcysteine O-methyltransferase Ste14
MALIAAAWLFARWSDSVPVLLRIAGLGIAAVGLALAVWARRTLGSAFTAFPEPRSGGTLVARGPYRLARHPMYGGGLLFFAGGSLVRSTPALVLTVALAVLWWRKTVVEERRLSARYDGYEAYRRRTPRRFLPFLA